MNNCIDIEENDPDTTDNDKSMNLTQDSTANPVIENIDRNYSLQMMKESKFSDCREPQDISMSLVLKDIDFISEELEDTAITRDYVSNYDDDIFLVCPILILPREIVLKIFAFFSQRELCSSISLVCKQWYDLAFDPSLWKVIDLHEYNYIPSVNLCRLISKATNLKTLILFGREDISESEVTVFIQYIPNLKNLDLGFCNSVDKTILTIIVEHCPLLESINLEGNTTLRKGSVQILSRCKHLKKINLSHCCTENQDVQHLASRLDMIENLNIDGISWIDDETVIYLVKRHNRSLQELAIDGAELTDDCFKEISSCSNLTALEASFCELLTDQTLLYLQNLSKLKKLRLRKGTDFSTDGLVNFFSMTHLSNLTSLDLSECTAFEDNCVLQMTKSCGKTLQYLSLCWCWFITDIGSTSIVDHCCNLIELDLTGLDKIYGDCFGRVPTEIPHLKLLNLSQCNKIKDDLIELVVRQKRDLKAINYYGENVEFGS